MKKPLVVIASILALNIVVILVAIFAVGSAFSALMNGATSFITSASVGDDCVAPGVLSTGTVNTDKRFFTSDENAARIYTQAQGLGLGDVAALTGIAVALQESSLNNGGVGDTFGTSAVASKYGGTVGDMTQSRGMFQQTAAWVEQGRAWSGMRWTAQDSKRVFSAFDPVTSEADPWNPWTGVGWALRDPRMDHAQAANMFFLGPRYNSKAGLEDAPIYKKYRTTPVTEVPDEAIAEMGQWVQRASKDRVLAQVPNARKYLERIQKGDIPVPAFNAPEPNIAERATTPLTKNALGNTVSQVSTNTTDTIGDGLLLVGDSVMVGIAKTPERPQQGFGGEVVVLAQTSMNLDTVLNHAGVRTYSGKKVNLDEWRDTIANGPSRILVQLGTNPSSANTVDGIASFMELAGPGKEVFWYSMHWKGASAFNNALLEAQSRYPNLHIVDSSSTVTTFNDIHPGAKAYAQMWDKAVQQMLGTASVPSQLIAVTCGGTSTNAFNDTIAPTGPYQRAAITWAREHLTSVTGGRYTSGNGWCGGSATGCGDPDLDDFNCSTYTSAGYQAATNGKVKLPVYSDSQWLDKTNIQLIPAAQAQPGDLLWQKTHPQKLSGHVLIIESIEGDGTVLHAANPTDGIVRGSLKNRGSFLGLKDPTNPSRGADNIKYTDNWDEAYVGRVIIPVSA